MRQISVNDTAKAMRPVIIAAAAISATVGLFAAVPSASQAATSHNSGEPVVPTRASVIRDAALAWLAATESRARGLAGLSLTKGAVSTAQVAPPGARSGARTGVIAGVVHDVTGGPFRGACVTATGPAGYAVAVSRRDGRYLLSGLRPGKYSLHATVCAGARNATGRPRVVSVWPGLPAMVAVRAGQITTLTPATIGEATRFVSRPVSAVLRAKTGSISGHVTGHGRPLRGICVAAIPVGSGLIAAATTSKTGRYRISGLPPRRYQVEFAGGSFCATGGNWLSQWYPYITSPFPTGKAANLRVRAGKDLAEINGKLKLGGEIAGTVRATSGKRLPNICVDVNENLAGNLGIGFGFATNEHGSFVLGGLFPGQYTLEFTSGCGNKGDYAYQWWRGATSQFRATVIHIRGTRVVRNIDPVLGPGAAVSGTVKGRNAAGPPLAGVCVSANGSDGNDDADAGTVKNGHYTLIGLATGKYQIQFDPSCGNAPTDSYLLGTRSLRVKAGQTVSGFNAYLAPGAAISGKVTDTRGHALGGICVQINDFNGDLTQTNPNGTYSLTGIQPGSYTVEFAGGCGNTGSLAPQWYDNQPDEQSANPVGFKGGKTTANIDAVMRPGGTIAGVVTNTSGRRLSGVCVFLSTESDIALGGGFFSVTQTDHGRYLIQNLVPGPYVIDFGCPGGPYASQWFQSQPDSTTAELVAVNPGVTARANATLTPAGSIAGTVTNQAGRRLSNICVTAANARNKIAISMLTGPAFTVQGRYRISGLTAGRYLVQFSHCVAKPRYGEQWYRDRTTANFATPVVVKPGRTTRAINGTLTPGGSISGVVAGPSGKPVRGLCVEAFDQPAQSGGIAMTSKSGHYKFTGLATGRYSLYFFPCFAREPNFGEVTRPGLVRVVAPKAVTGIDIKVELGGWISGTVSSAQAPKTPQSQVCVLLVPENPNGSFGFGLTDASGRYLVSNLAPGKYQAYFDDPSCNFIENFSGMGGVSLAPQWYKDRLTQATANYITVTAGHTTTGISAALQPYGSITGRVTNAAHGDVAGECVTAVPVKAPLDEFSGLPQPSEVAISGFTGRYTLADLLPGRYKVEFSGGCGAKGHATQWWRNANSARSATVISVGYATISKIDASLRR
jgi:hypothetical protein